jgi:hypothetical protein
MLIIFLFLCLFTFHQHKQFLMVAQFYKGYASLEVTRLEVKRPKVMRLEIMQREVKRREVTRREVMRLEVTRQAWRKLHCFRVTKLPTLSAISVQVVVSKGVGRRLQPAIRAATPKTALQLFLGWPLTWYGEVGHSKT